MIFVFQSKQSVRYTGETSACRRVYCFNKFQYHRDIKGKSYYYPSALAREKCKMKKVKISSE